MGPWLILAGIYSLLGLAIGSFLNVFIHRYPRGESLLLPGSHCPICQTPIAWYDNIPVVSYLFLRARCRHCSVAIAWRYPAVEAANGLLYLLLFIRFGPTLPTPLYCLLGSACLAVACIDFDEMIIPDIITYSGVVTGLLAAALGWLPITAWQALLGVVFAVLFLGSIYLGSLVLLHKEGLGQGDIKYLAMVGAFLGLEAAAMTVFLGAILGTVITLTLIGLGLHKRENYFPFGPFLVAATLLVLFFGADILDWYGGMFTVPY
jgi:leader peptidase (prepilin peptidase) / N-methyltransferase